VEIMSGREGDNHLSVLEACMGYTFSPARDFNGASLGEYMLELCGSLHPHFLLVTFAHWHCGSPVSILTASAVSHGPLELPSSPTHAGV